MSDTGHKKPAIARYKNGEAVTEHEANMIARAFGFMSAAAMNETCRAADHRRARRQRLDDAA